jgi:hypothetical protein
MSRQSHLSSQANQNDKFNGSSQQLTLNVTLKDLNIEARKILRRKLLRDSVQTSRDESDVYVSGPYFPCGEYNLKKRLRKNSVTSLTENCANDGGISKAEKSSFVEIVITEDKSNQTERFSEVEHGKTKVFESWDSSTLSKTKVPILSVSDHDLTEVSKLSEPEENHCAPSTTEDYAQQGTRSNEFENTKLLEDRKKQTPGSANSRRPSSNLQLSKEKQSVTITTEECLQGTVNNTTSLEEKRNPLPRSPNSRRSSQLEARSRGTSPLFQRRRERRMSGNEKKTSPNHSRNNSAATDHFALENILNPLLRESLKKILNPQRSVENAISNDTDNTSPLVANDSRSIFKDDILLPKIKRRLVKYSSLDYGDQSKRSSMTNDSLRDKYRKKSTRHVRFNEQTPELTSTKCTGIKVTRSHPVRMLSGGSEYAVKGVIGQWLKRRSGNTAQAGREKASVEKQEAYREVQLLKVGMSMRMLAGIV